MFDLQRRESVVKKKSTTRAQHGPTTLVLLHAPHYSETVGNKDQTYRLFGRYFGSPKAFVLAQKYQVAFIVRGSTHDTRYKVYTGMINTLVVERGTARTPRLLYSTMILTALENTAVLTNKDLQLGSKRRNTYYILRRTTSKGHNNSNAGST